MSDLKVCLANDSFPPQIDGVANTIKNYAEIITEHHGSAVVATPAFPKNEDEKYPFPIVRYPSMPLWEAVEYRAGYPFWPKAIDALKTFGPDIIHSHCPMVSSYLCRELRTITGVPLVFTYHTKFDLDIKRVLKLRPLQRTIIKAVVANISACDEVWVVSNGAGENLRDLGYEGTYRVMPNGVDIPRLPRDETIYNTIRAKYNLPDDEAIFLSVGRMKWIKNHRITIKALRIIKDAGFKFKMIFVGAGSDLDDIIAFTEEMGVRENCIFTGAVHDREYLRNSYFCADMFVFPSTYDTNGIVVREASACGLGSILIRNSCAAEGIEDGVCGMLTEENPESLAKALAAVCSDRETARKIGKNAENTLYISWEDSVARAVLRYGEIIDAKKRGELPPPAGSKTAPDEQAIRLIAATFKPYARIKDTERRRKQAAADREAAYFAYEDPAEHEWFERQVVEEQDASGDILEDAGSGEDPVNTESLDNPESLGNPVSLDAPERLDDPEAGGFESQQDK